MKTGFILAIITILLVYISTNIYVFIRGYQAIPHMYPWRLLFIIVATLLFACSILGLVLADAMPMKMTIAVQVIGNTWFIALLYCLMAVLFFDLLRLIHHFIPFFPSFITNHPSVSKFVIFVITVISVSGICLIGYIRFNHPKITHLQIHIPKPNTPQHLRIVMASDLHAGYMIGKNRIEKYVALINEQNPDLILLCGDLVDRNIKPLEKENTFDALQKLTAPKGIFAVLGNHEYISQHLDKVLALYAKANIRLLRDEAIGIDSCCYLIGRDDRSNPHRLSTKALLEKYRVDSSFPLLLMDHQPYHLEESEINHIDLHLSGHTHNGQVWPLNFITGKIFELSHGYKQKGNTHVYVSSGLGIWGALFRIGTQSELVVIDIVQ